MENVPQKVLGESSSGEFLRKFLKKVPGKFSESFKKEYSVGVLSFLKYGRSLF